MTQASMVAGQWYDLDPPANILGKRFPRVVCDYQVPNNPNEYCVRGTPEGGDAEEPFLLIFRPDRGVKVTPAAPPTDDPKPFLRVVK